jgi:hypothetical protein
MAAISGRTGCEKDVISSQVPEVAQISLEVHVHEVSAALCGD